MFQFWRFFRDVFSAKPKSSISSSIWDKQTLENSHKNSEASVKVVEESIFGESQSMRMISSINARMAISSSEDDDDVVPSKPTKKPLGRNLTRSSQMSDSVNSDKEKSFLVEDSLNNKTKSFASWFYNYNVHQ